MRLPAVLLAGAIAALGAECLPDRDHYRGYTISAVRTQTMLDFPEPVRWLFRSAGIAASEQEAADLLPFGRGDRFERSMLGAGEILLAKRYAQEINRPGERVRGALILPGLTDCDEAAKTVAMVYRIYSTDAAYFAARLFESKPQVDRRLAIGDAAKTETKTFPLPFGGYDAARKLSGGLRGDWTTSNPLVRMLHLEASGSARSHRSGFGFSGFRNPERGRLSHLEWRGAFRDVLEPAGGLELRQSTTLAQFAGASRAAGPLGLILRFGGQLEGGHRQSNLTAPGVLANAPHGALKGYLGATFRTARSAWSASYGVQAGKASPGFQADYRKQIADIAYQGRLLWREHFPLRVEAQATGGWIASESGRVPVAERFFGGNLPREFIEGDSWRIRSSPLLRSFPQNRLNRVGAGPAAGGTSFAAANFTVAQTVWAKSTLPSAVRDSQELLDGINLNLDKVRLDGLAEYRIQHPELARVIERLKPLEAEVKALTPAPSVADQIVATIVEALEDPKTDMARNNARALAVDQDSLLELLSAELREAGKADAAAHFDTIRLELAKGLEAVERSVSLDKAAFAGFTADRTALEDLFGRIDARFASVPGVARRAEAARNSLPGTDDPGIDLLGSWRRLGVGTGKLLPPQLERLALVLEAQADPAARDFAVEVRKVRESIRSKVSRLALPEGERHTMRQTAYIPNTMDVVFRELNLAAISPVAIFDAARIGPAGGGLRYGVGGGVRFTIVTLDITAGYAVNANRRRGDPRGALFFSLDVTDLFR